MDIAHGLLLLITLATLVATLALWKQRLTPLVDRAAVADESPEDLPRSSLEPTTRPMRVAVLDDETAARRERQAREKAPNPELAQ
jgi:hypothetical protein